MSRKFLRTKLVILQVIISVILMVMNGLANAQDADCEVQQDPALKPFRTLVSQTFYNEYKNQDPAVKAYGIFKNYFEISTNTINLGSTLSEKKDIAIATCRQRLQSRDPFILDNDTNSTKKRYYNLKLLEGTGSAFKIASLDMSKCPAPGKPYFNAIFVNWEYDGGSYKLAKCHTSIKIYCDNAGSPINEDGSANISYLGACKASNSAVPTASNALPASTSVATPNPGPTDPTSVLTPTPAPATISTPASERSSASRWVQLGEPIYASCSYTALMRAFGVYTQTGNGCRFASGADLPEGALLFVGGYLGEDKQVWNDERIGTTKNSKLGCYTYQPGTKIPGADTCRSYSKLTCCEARFYTWVEGSVPPPILSMCDQNNYLTNPLCDIVTDKEKEDLKAQPFARQLVSFTIPAFNFSTNKSKINRECKLGKITYGSNVIADCNGMQPTDNKYYFCQAGCVLTNDCYYKAKFGIDPVLLKTLINNDPNLSDYFNNANKLIKVNFEVFINSDYNPGQQGSGFITNMNASNFATTKQPSDSHTCVFTADLSKEKAELAAVQCNIKVGSGAQTLNVKNMDEYTKIISESVKSCS